MKSQSLNNIASMYRTSIGLKTFFDKFKEKTSESSCDKFGAKFCSDNRFAVFSLLVSFDAWTGHYGNSSCGTFSNGINSDIAEKIFVEAIQQMREDIFAKMAEIALDHARELESEARKDIANAQALLDKVMSGE